MFTQSAAEMQYEFVDQVFTKLIRLGIMEGDEETVRFTEPFCDFVMMYSTCKFDPEEMVGIDKFKEIILTFNVRAVALTDDELAHTMNAYVSMIMAHDLHEEDLV